MTEEAKRDWLTVAWSTLGDLPVDILRTAARKARLTVDHPAKIVPAIVAESRDWMRLRREEASEADASRLAPPDRCTPEQAAAILEEFGLGSRFASERREGH